MGKSDIVYTGTRQGSVHQAVVRLNCLNGVEFRGLPRADRKQAEHAAAKEALQAFSKDRAVMLRAFPKKRKVQAEATSSRVAPNIKRRLHEICLQIVGRAPQAGDIV